jgi:hypothetical protein
VTFRHELFFVVDARKQKKVMVTAHKAKVTRQTMPLAATSS